MDALLLSVLLAVASPEEPKPILCPPYPGDPPWRPITCYMLSHLTVPPDRPYVDYHGKPFRFEWKPVEEGAGS
jgi:hypothetical protein